MENIVVLGISLNQIANSSNNYGIVWGYFTICKNMLQKREINLDGKIH
jgi:hypothetical protein